MNHPTPDQWMSFLYGEDNESQRRDLDLHLRGCAECAARLKSLRAGMCALDDWPLPQRRPARPRPVLQWAAAAVVMLAAGIGIGRFSAGGTEAMHASMQQEMDTKLAAAKADTQQLLAGLTSPTQAAVRAETQLKLQEVLNSMDPMDREVVVLRHFEELSNIETAAVLGIESSAASKRYLRAIRRLKAILNQIPGFFA